APPSSACCAPRRRCGEKPGRALILRAAQVGLEVFALGVPALIFQGGAAVELVARRLDRGHRVVMALLGAGQGGLGLFRVALALRAGPRFSGLIPRRFFFPRLLAAGLFLFEGDDGSALGLVVTDL